jgi:hypothetical protein
VFAEQVLQRLGDPDHPPCLRPGRPTAELDRVPNALDPDPERVQLLVVG